VTHFQRMLNALGCWRFKRYRRWVGGVWVERYIERAPHSSRCPYWRWVQDPNARFDDNTHAIEQWSIQLPEAQVRSPE
jgi:hypothetical protein